MEQSIEKIPSDLDWQVTAITIWCAFVDERVTLIVKNDWTTYCCWNEEHKEDSSSRKLEKCAGPVCSYSTDYRDRLIREELK